MRKARNRRLSHQTSWDGCFEGLEQRVLLSGSVTVEEMTWFGATSLARTDSWILTFTHRMSNEQSIARANEVAAALGVVPESIEPIGRGRWARLTTSSAVTEAAATAAMHNLGFLMAVEPEWASRPALTPNDARFAEQWPHLNVGQFIPGSGEGIPGADISSTLAWNQLTGSRQVVVAVLDTGIDLFHPDLMANLWVNQGEIPGNGLDDDGNGFIDDVYGWDFGDNDNNPQDQQGHGTAVAGVIGAVGNNGIGVAGVNWQVSMIALKVFPDDSEFTFTGMQIGALDYVTMLITDFGINIVVTNNSYGGLASGSDFFDVGRQVAIQDSVDAGALFVAAAGNESNDNDGAVQAYPASHDNPMIISVAATDNRDQLADFSNWGLTSVDLGAPGVRTLTTAVGGGYEFIDGTSFASPYTAGVVALLAAASPFATPAQLRDAILDGADLVTALIGRTVTGGRLNAFRALQLVGFPGPLVLNISPGSVSGPVGTIQVQFNEPIDPTFVAPAGIELRRANLDGDFDGDDIFISIPASNITIDGAVMTITSPVGLLPLDEYRLTLRAAYFRDLEGNLLNGTTVSGNDEVYHFRIIAGGGALEPNDNLNQAIPVIYDGAGNATFAGLAIGDGPHSSLDVDMFRITLLGAGLITVRVDARNLPVPSELDSVIRVFDASGKEIARNDNFNGLDSFVQIFVNAGGRYYVGISGFGNAEYNPLQVATGTAGQSTGLYNVSFHIVPASPEQITYSSPPGAIPIPASGTITSGIFVPDIRTIADLNVRINITHTFVGDLRITLTSPTGVVIPLVLNRGGSGDDFTDTLFDDSAAISIAAATAPFTGSFRPESPLEAVNRDSASGLWVLTITDTAPLNSGMLISWALEFTLEAAPNGLHEFNDTIFNATDSTISGTGTAQFGAVIGDGAFGRRDVDLFRVVVDAGTTLTVHANSDGQLDTVLRLFDQQGNPLLIDARPDSRNSTFSYPVQMAGIYYIGVSGGANTDYQSTVAASGTPTNETGNYILIIEVTGGVTEGAVVLTGNNMLVGVNRDGSIGIQSTATTTGINIGGIEFVAGTGALADDSESFFGAIFDGFTFQNAGASHTEVPMSIANQSDFRNRRLVAEGLFRGPIPEAGQGGLLIRRALSFGLDDSFIAVDISLTNTTFSPMGQVGWVEGLRGLQAALLGSPFTRTIHNRDNATGRLVTSTYYDEDFPAGLTLAIGAPEAGPGITVTTSVEAVGTVRDAFQVVGSPVDPDPSDAELGDERDGLLTVGFDIGDLDPGETVHLRYFIFAGTSLMEVRSRFQELEAGTGSGHLVGDPLDTNIAAADLPYAVYYPEGFANDRARTFLPISNPHHVPARVVVIARYEDPNLPAEVIADTVMNPDSRGGITITTPELFAADQQLVAKNTPYALEIRSSVPVGATLSHFDFGISTGQAFTSEASTTWTFSEGFKSPGINDFLVFLNTSDQDIKVTLTVFHENTGQQFAFTQEVGAGKRGGWDLGATQTIPDGPFAMRLDAEAPIVAALTHFDSNLGGGFALLGLPNAGATKGVSPEGQLGLNSGTEFVTILNAGNQAADITFTFLFANQSAFRYQMRVQPGRRSGFNVAQLPGFPSLNQPYAVTYESTQPVSVSLSSFAFGAGAATRFTDTAHTFWVFSEGFRPGVGSAVTEYLRLFSHANDPVTVEIAIDFAPNPAFNDPGGTETFRRVLTPRAANDFNIHDFITGVRRDRDTFYSISIRSATPITAYTGRYDAFLNGGFGTLGTPLGNTMPSLL